ncbi:hypothetical protein AB0877_07250 [Micromonospora sp. NPDC047644]|uniref:hypothetical protein n=1 Tax=Micromonospora sp. NPDC047644 TaxID=3157203 RepID=UPI00345513EB
MTSTPPLARPALAPIVAVDADSVLNPEDPTHAMALGYQPHRYDGPSPDGRHVTGTVWLPPNHGPWLRELANHSQPVWCTSWNHLAAEYRATTGITSHLAAHPRPRGRIRIGHQSKLGPLYAWVARRPLGVLDDEFGGKAPFTADQRTAGGTPTLPRPVNPFHGLRRADIDAVLTWLRQL